TQRTGEQLLIDWMTRSKAIGIVQCADKNSVLTDGPPFASTTISFTAISSFRGAVPQSVQQAGGAFYDHVVVNAEEPYVQLGLQYIGFFGGADNALVLLAAPEFDQNAKQVWVVDSYFSVDRIAALATTT